MTAACSENSFTVQYLNQASTVFRVRARFSTRIWGDLSWFEAESSHDHVQIVRELKLEHLTDRELVGVSLLTTFKVPNFHPKSSAKSSFRSHHQHESCGLQPH